MRPGNDWLSTPTCPCPKLDKSTTVPLTLIFRGLGKFSQIQKERIEIERLKAEQEKVFQANLERERAVEKSLREKPQELEMVYRPRNRTGPGMRR